MSLVAHWPLTEQSTFNETTGSISDYIGTYNVGFTYTFSPISSGIEDDIWLRIDQLDLEGNIDITVNDNLLVDGVGGTDNTREWNEWQVTSTFINNTAPNVIKIYHNGGSADWGTIYEVQLYSKTPKYYVEDYSGNRYDGTTTNITFADGKIGQAASFNGDTSTISTSYNFNYNLDFSIALWMKRDLAASWVRAVDFGQGDYPGLVGIHSNEQGFFSYRKANGIDLGYFYYDINTYANQLEWFHVVVTHKRLSSTSVLKAAYVNGQLSNSSIITDIKTNYTGNIRISASDANRSFNGDINDVRIYDHALTDMEIQELSRAKILHYTFNDFQEPTTNLIGNVIDTTFESTSGISTYSTLTVTDEIKFNDHKVYKIQPDTDASGFNITSDIWIDEGDIVTMSYWVYIPSDQTMTRSWEIHRHMLPDGTCDGGNCHHYNVIDYTYKDWDNTSPKDKWFKRYITIQASLKTVYTVINGYYARIFAYSSSGAADGHFYITEPQIEKKTYPTEFAPGIRTGKVLDSSGFYNDSEPLTEINTPRWIKTEGRNYSLNDLVGLDKQSLSGTIVVTPTIENNYLKLTNSSNSWNGIYDITRKYRNFEIFADINTDSDHMGIGFSNPNNGDQAEGYQWVIRLQYAGSNDNRIQKWSSGTQTYITASAGPAIDSTLTQNQWISVRLVVKDMVVNAWINGVKTLDNIDITAVDTSFNNGYVGLITYQNVSTLFKNVKIIDLDTEHKIGMGAYAFRASDAVTYIHPPTDLIPTYKDFTVSAWVYFISEPTETNLGYVIAQHYGGGGWILSIRGTDEKLQFRHHRDTANGFTTAYNLLSTVSLQKNTWYHVAAKDDGSTAKIYINGLENNSFTISTIIPGPSSVSPRIGAFSTSGHAHFDGKIDDVRIYATALSDADILDLYQTRAEIEESGILYSKAFISNVEPTTNSIDDTAGNTWGGYTGLTISQIAEYNQIENTSLKIVINSSWSNTAARVKFGNTTSVEDGKYYFISIYARKDPSMAEDLVTLRTYTGYNWYNLTALDGGDNYLTNEYRRFGVYALTGVNSGGPNPAFGAWTYGALEGDTVYFMAPQAELLDHPTPFTNSYRPLIPEIDENFFEYGANEVQDTGISNFEDFSTAGIVDGLIGYWSFNNNINDYSGNNYTGTISGTATLTDNYINFSGNSNHIDLGQPIFSTTDDAHEFSVIAIINAHTFSVENWIISQYAASTYRGIWNTHTNGKMRYFVGGTSIFGNSTLSLNTWYHVAITKDSNGLITFYLNGQSDGSGTLLKRFDNTNTDIGTPLSYAQDLDIEYLKVFNRPLTPEEISIEYNTMFNNEVQVHESGTLYAKKLNTY